MFTTLSRTARTALVVALLGAAFAAESTLAQDTGDREPIFDFTNAYYLENGVRPGRLVGRRNGTDGLSVFDEPLHPNQRNVRITLTAPAFDHSGNLFFFAPNGLVPRNGFTNDAAGQEARAIAEEFAIYEFPRATNGPGVVFPKRQASLVDLSGGYFSNDPLGLWVLIFVTYTDAAFETEEGQAALAELAARNGTDLDGTPIIRTLSEISSLADAGFVDLHKRPRNGSEGERYFVCPVFKDPRDGAIAADAFLDMVRDDNGEVLPAEAFMLDEFLCLQHTGDFCG